MLMRKEIGLLNGKKKNCYGAVSQALPMVTVIVAAKSKDKMCRILTAAEGADEPKYVEFECPTKEARLKPGKPSWANYVKGVIDCFPDKCTSHSRSYKFVKVMAVYHAVHMLCRLKYDSFNIALKWF